MKENQKRAERSPRALILFTILFIVALMVAPPLQNYFVQRAQISSLQGEVNQARADLEAARAELARWRNPEYVRSQARDRLRFVMPGERQYIVLGIAEEKSPDQVTAAPVAENFPLGIPWYARLLSSITAVGATR